MSEEKAGGTLSGEELLKAYQDTLWVRNTLAYYWHSIDEKTRLGLIARLDNVIWELELARNRLPENNRLVSAHMGKERGRA